MIKNTKKAYSFFEILVVFVIISIIALSTTPFLVKKGKKKNEKKYHGTYACTIFDGEEYFFLSDKRNAAIPKEKYNWNKGRCGTAFVMPYKAGLLNVKVLGGGGAGGNGSGDWDESISPKTFYGSGSYNVPVSGYYDIIISGDKGSNSSVVQWEVSVGGTQHNCFAEAAKSGDNAFFSGTRYLYKNNVLDIVYEAAYPVSLNLDCTNEIETPSAYPGNNGSDIIVKLDSSELVRVEGSKAGTYTCNSLNLCGKHFEAVKGENGKVNAGYFMNKVEKTGESSYEPGVVIIRWSDMNQTYKAFKPEAGCGGTPGEISSVLYPILRDKLPKIQIGAGGTPETDPSDSYFGMLKASAGKNNILCTTTENQLDGKDGKPFTIIPELESQAGAGGKSVPSTLINGEPAKGYASGGGGGAVYYASLPYYDNLKSYEENKKPTLNGVTRWYEGRGGNGGSGLLIITW